MTETQIQQIRRMPAEERVRRLQAWKEQRSTPDAEISTTNTSWHEVDREVTPDQYVAIPPAQPGDTRTPDLWVKFKHPRLKELIVSRGYFDYEGTSWRAQRCSIEGTDSIGEVVAIAWAPIVVGERPWEAPTIRENVADPW